jgi:hypothetical protein
MATGSGGRGPAHREKVAGMDDAPPMTAREVLAEYERATVNPSLTHDEMLVLDAMRDYGFSPPADDPTFRELQRKAAGLRRIRRGGG